MFGSSQWEDLADNRRVVHLRMNTRTDADGNKVLFLEEVQSDWGQKGKKEGFSDKKFVFTYLDEKGIETKEFKTRKEAEDFRNIIPSSKHSSAGIREIDNGSVATAPFVMDTNAWTKLGLKVALKEAVAQGIDKIAWTTGEQQNDRYDLSKQVDAIHYVKNTDGTYSFNAEKDGNEFSVVQNNVSEKNLESLVGKEVAQKIINNEGEVKRGKDTRKGAKTLKGNDLKVGGKGMKGFYGEPSEGKEGIVGGVAKALVKELTGYPYRDWGNSGNEDSFR